jgi:hypothetical protein
MKQNGICDKGQISCVKVKTFTVIRTDCYCNEEQTITVIRTDCSCDKEGQTVTVMKNRLLL